MHRHHYMPVAIAENNNVSINSSVKVTPTPATTAPASRGSTLFFNAKNGVKYAAHQYKNNDCLKLIILNWRGSDVY
ncbi:MAG: hypothetical protein AB8B87_18665 [Granulosicoccus sp.]